MHKEFKAFKVSKVLLERKDCRESKGPKAFKVLQVLKAFKVSKGLLVLKEYKE